MHNSSLILCLIAGMARAAAWRALAGGFGLVLAIFVSLSLAQLHQSDVAALREIARNLTIFNWDPENAPNACTTFQYSCSYGPCGIICDEAGTYVKSLVFYPFREVNLPLTVPRVNWAPFGWFSNLSSIFISYNVRFGGCFLPNEVLSNLTTLTSINIDGSGPNCATALLNLTGPPLQKIFLSGFVFSNGYPALEGLGSTLVSLGIYQSSLQPNVLPIPESWNQLTSLTQLSLQYVKATGLRELFFNLTALTTLNLANVDLSQDTLEGLGNLKNLYIGSTTNTFPNMSALVNLQTLTLFSVVYPATAFQLPALEILIWYGGAPIAISDDWNMPSLKILLLAVTSDGPFPSTINRSRNLTTLLFLYQSSFSSLPADLSGLTSLETLNFPYMATNPQVSGFGTIPNLKSLALTMGPTTDASFVANMTSLEGLFLTGQSGIRATLAFENVIKLTNLTGLSLNMLTLVEGNIYGINNLTKLQSLSLSNINFNGSLPLMSLSALNHLSITDCTGLTGPFPDLVNFPVLKTLNLQTVTFSALPNITGANYLESLTLATWSTPYAAFPEIAPPGAPNLTSVVFKLPSLSWPLPTGLRYSTKLKFLSLQNCPSLNAPIPTEWSELSALEELEISSCMVTGLPSSLNQLTRLKTLKIQNSGIPSIPSDWGTGFGNLTTVTVSLNDFSLSQFPMAFLNHSSIESLELVSNKYPSLDMPDFSNMTSLRKLTLQGDFITGSLSDSLTKQGTLQELRIQNARISGPIPSSYLQAPMSVLDLSFNPLQTSLPEAPPNCTLTEVSIQSAQLIGGIPASWTNCTQLRTIRLSYNSLGPYLGSALFSKRLMLDSVSLQYNQFSDVDDWPADILDDYSFAPFPDSINLQSNNFTGPISPRMIKTIAKAGRTWDLEYNRIECPRHVLEPNLWQKRAPFSDFIGTNVRLSHNYLGLPGDINTVACPSLRLAPVDTLDPSYSVQLFSNTPCDAYSWQCAGAQPKPDAPCIAPGLWYILGELEVAATKPLSLDSSATVTGNFTVSSNATVQVKPGVVVSVRGCVSLSGNLVVDASNITWGSNASSNPSSVPFIVFDGSDGGFCSGFQQFESVTVLAEQRPCESLSAVDQPSSSGLNILFRIDSTGYADRSQCEPAPPSAAVAAPSLNIIGIAVGASIAGAAVVVVLLIIFVRPLRRRVFPFLERRMTVATEMRQIDS